MHVSRAFLRVWLFVLKHARLPEPLFILLPLALHPFFTSLHPFDARFSRSSRGGHESRVNLSNSVVSSLTRLGWASTYFFQRATYVPRTYTHTRASFHARFSFAAFVLERFRSKFPSDCRLSRFGKRATKSGVAVYNVSHYSYVFFKIYWELFRTNNGEMEIL